MTQQDSEEVKDAMQSSSSPEEEIPFTQENNSQQSSSMLKSQVISGETASAKQSPEVALTSYGKTVTFHPLANLPGVYHVDSMTNQQEDENDESDNNRRKLESSAVETVEMLNVLRKVKAKEREDFKRLKDYNIPGQKTLLNALLEDDHYMHNFNGFIREYYSHILRSYCLMNMQGRYRGLQPSATCLTMIDISRLTSKEVAQENRQRELAMEREDMLSKLRVVALDELHFKYLKELANNQPLILPMSIMHGILMETAPAVKSVWNYYCSHLGKNHRCAIQAGQHYVRLAKRQEMYQKLGFGDNVITELETS